jgi:hypothetical protein
MYIQNYSIHSLSLMFSTASTNSRALASLFHSALPTQVRALTMMTELLYKRLLIVSHEIKQPLVP